MREVIWFRGRQDERKSGKNKLAKACLGIRQF